MSAPWLIPGPLWDPVHRLERMFISAVVWALVAASEPLGLLAELADEAGPVVERRKLRVEGTGQGCALQPPGPGAWQVRVGPAGDGSGPGALVRPVSAVTLVCPAEERG